MHTPEQQFCLTPTSVKPGSQTLPYPSSQCTQPSNRGALFPITSVPTAICSLFLPGLSLTFCSPGSALHVSLKHALACHFLGRFNMPETTKKGKKFRTIQQTYMCSQYSRESKIFLVQVLLLSLSSCLYFGKGHKCSVDSSGSSCGNLFFSINILTLLILKQIRMCCMFAINPCSNYLRTDF